MTKAEKRALEAYDTDTPAPIRFAFRDGYEQAEKDIITTIKDYVKKGLRCMEQSDKFQMHTFWDGFHNCAENILRELEGENERD